ncbi:MAG TPA: family 2 glycosyl transferase [Cytophagales bacterium]|jgi:glycosyltransferase involved in cell wall biosynthesis|nr:family 2 glycosyl transferase [Cytophagales bacterium]
MTLDKGTTESKNCIYLAEVNESESRPFWSVIIPTYNCAEYLRECLESVLIQDPGEDQMQIIVVDDHSTEDDPEEVVNTLAKDRVQFIRQAQNVGKVRNYEAGLEASKGKVIHLLHGDDRVRDGFYETMQLLLSNHPNAQASFCRSMYINAQGLWTGITGMIQDQDGIVPDMLERLYVNQLIQTPSMVVRREVYETIGTFDRRLNAMEDWEMWIRIASHFPISCSNSVLAEYRTHDENATVSTFVDGSALTIHQDLFKIVDSYIDDKIKLNLLKKRRKNQAYFLYQSLIQLEGKLPQKVKNAIKFRMFCLDPGIRTALKVLTN